MKRDTVKVRCGRDTVKVRYGRVQQGLFHVQNSMVCVDFVQMPFRLIR